MPLYRRLPKRGFKNFEKKNIAILNLSKIQTMFDKKKNELTQKGTFKRNNILKNFESEIKIMYKKNYISLRNQNKEVRMPNWLIREIGTVKSNIKWDDN